MIMLWVDRKEHKRMALHTLLLYFYGANISALNVDVHVLQKVLQVFWCKIFYTTQQNEAAPGFSVALLAISLRLFSGFGPEVDLLLEFYIYPDSVRLCITLAQGLAFGEITAQSNLNWALAKV